MALTVPGRRTVTVIRRVRRAAPGGSGWARDGRGNAVYDDVREDVPGCSVQPGGSNEQNDDQRTETTSSATIYAPLSWPAGPSDAVEFDGRRWEQQGHPQRWTHPRLGHVVVTVQEAGA